MVSASGSGRYMRPRANTQGSMTTQPETRKVAGKPTLSGGARGKANPPESVVTLAPAPSMRTSVRATGASSAVRTPPEMDRVGGAAAEADSATRRGKTPAVEQVRREDNVPSFCAPLFIHIANPKASNRMLALCFAAGGAGAGCRPKENAPGAF